MIFRRVVSLALVGAVLLPLPASASGAGTNHYVVDRLKAEWILEGDDARDFNYVVVSVTRRTNLDTGKEKLTGAVGRGSCFEDGESFGCQAMLDPYNVTEFEADPGFTSVRVALRRGRFRHTIEFKSSAPFAWAPGQEPNLCGGTTTVVHVMARNATAEGRVFGRHLSTAEEYEPERAAETIVQNLEIEECT